VWYIIASIAQFAGIAHPQGEREICNIVLQHKTRTRHVCNIVMSHLGGVATGNAFSQISLDHGIRFMLYSQMPPDSYGKSSNFPEHRGPQRNENQTNLTSSLSETCDDQDLLAVATYGREPLQEIDEDPAQDRIPPSRGWTRIQA